MTETAIQITNLSVQLGGQPILQDISVTIPAGSVVGLLGPSGAGKTTLMRIIIGRQRFDTGSAVVLGLAAGSPDMRVLIGYMPQEAAVYPDLTVMENLRYFAAMVNASGEHVATILRRVELIKQANQLVSTLSGGQKSRVSLAVALLGEPRLLVLDEPTVGLDPVLRRQLWKLFHELAAHGTTLLVSSHVMDEAAHCKHLLLIRDGRILTYGTPSDIKAQTGSSDIEESFIKLIGNGNEP